jgi:hypothetical protein
MSSLGNPTHPTINGFVQPFCEKPECMMPFLAVSSPIPKGITLVKKDSIVSSSVILFAICNPQSAI